MEAVHYCSATTIWQEKEEEKNHNLICSRFLHHIKEKRKEVFDNSELLFACKQTCTMSM